jgi:ATP-binding cassette subfamily C protein CydD
MHIDRRLLAVARGYGPALLGAVGFGAAAGVATVVQAWLLARVVAQVFLHGAARAELAVPLGFMIAVIAVRAALGWIADAFAARAAAGVKHELRGRVYSHLLDRGPVAAGQERTGELVAALTEGIDALDAYISGYLPQLALAAVIPLTVAAVVLTRDSLSGLVLLSTAPLIPVFMYLIGGLADRRARRQWLRLARLSAFFLDTIQGLTTLKVLGRTREQAVAIRLVSEAFRSSSMSLLRIAFLSALVLELVATLSVAVVAVEIGVRLLAGGLAFEQAFFVLLLAPEFYLPLRRLGATFHAGLAGATAAQRLFGLLEAPVPRARPTSPRLMPERPSLAFEEVSFTYSTDGRARGSSRPALDGVSLRIDPGEMVAVVGPSGAGKSTLASILLRFAEPTGGRLTADGIDARAIDPEDWRRAIAWVSQRPHLFADTVAANILLARPDASAEDVESAARRARADRFIDELTQGYETPIGERGARLSGGQAQRLALTRAFLAGAPVLVLDEPTANLDPRLQAEIDEALDELVAGRSALVIAHRVPTVLKANRVVVLDRGRVIDEGTHDRLLDRCDLYRSLVGAYRGRP